MLLVFLVLPGGVRTDEAKYLLSIPYPHPPAVRFLLASLKSFPFQEVLVRLILASAVVQSVWFVWDAGGVLGPTRRLALGGSWLLSSALILQAGTVMLAPITAVFGLMFLWTALLPAGPSKRAAPFVGLLWLFGLFGAYQTVLYLPLVWSALRHGKTSRKSALLIIGLPVVLLALYTLTNPLALASMLKVGGQDSTLAPAVRLQNLAWIWLIAGSGAGSLLGTWGLLVGGRKDLLLTGFILLIFVALSSQQYYAILLTPMLVGGIFMLLCRRKITPGIFLPLQAAMAVIFLVFFLPPFNTSTAHRVTEELRARDIGGPILIDGPFGHEWQYYSSVPVRRFTIDLSSKVEDQAQGIVCIRRSCEDQIDSDKWVRLDKMPAEVWVRR